MQDVCRQPLDNFSVNAGEVWLSPDNHHAVSKVSNQQPNLTENLKRPSDTSFAFKRGLMFFGKWVQSKTEAFSPREHKEKYKCYSSKNCHLLMPFSPIMQKAARCATFSEALFLFPAFVLLLRSGR